MLLTTSIAQIVLQLSHNKALCSYSVGFSLQWRSVLS